VLPIKGKPGRVPTLSREARPHQAGRVERIQYLQYLQAICASLNNCQ
jgi:hypothetical protein